MGGKPQQAYTGACKNPVYHIEIPQVMGLTGKGQTDRQDDGPKRDDHPGAKAILKKPGQQAHDGLGNDEDGKDA